MPTQGFRELDAQLKSLADAVGPRRADRVLRAALRFGMKGGLKLAEAKAPVRREGGMRKTYKGRLVTPGFLSRSLQVAVTKTKSGKAIALMGPTQEAYYGTTFVEKGTQHQSAQPWLEPAFRASSGRILERFATKLAKNIEKERKK